MTNILIYPLIQLLTKGFYFKKKYLPVFNLFNGMNFLLPEHYILLFDFYINNTSKTKKIYSNTKTIFFGLY